MLALPAIGQLQALDGDTRAAIVVVLRDFKADAQARADECWRKHKGPMAAYWKAAAVYAGHLARVLS